MDWTQEHLAEKVGLKRSLIGSYEEERAEPRISALQMIARVFEVGLDDLININMSGIPEAMAPYISGQFLRVLPVVVDGQGRERIVVVPYKAAAGYLSFYGDVDQYESLQSVQLSLPEVYREQSHRIFQIEGDSMLPVVSGTYVVTTYVEDWSEIKDGTACIIVSKSEGVVYKRVDNRIASKAGFVLRSDNLIYPEIELSARDVLEIWTAIGFISFELPVPDQQVLSMSEMTRIVLHLQSEWDMWKGKMGG